jgi:hypothetical protein
MSRKIFSVGMTCLANEKVYFTSSSQYDPLNPSFKHIPGNSLVLYLMRLEDALGDSSHSAHVAGGQRVAAVDGAASPISHDDLA